MRNMILKTCVLFLSCSFSWAEEVIRYFPIEVTSIQDGDTFTCDVDLGFGIVKKSARIRMLEFDAWETSRRRRTVIITDEEIVKGRIATDAFTGLLSSGEAYLYSVDTEGDPYGRVLAKVAIRQRDSFVDAGSWMIRRGHQRRNP